MMPAFLACSLPQPPRPPTLRPLQRKTSRLLPAPQTLVRALVLVRALALVLVPALLMPRMRARMRARMRTIWTTWRRS